MISYISGELKYITNEGVVIDNGGIGYAIAVSAKTMEGLPPVGNNVCIYTYMNVSENDLNLYGFASREEQELFNKIISVSGIGPKSALGILGSISPSQFIMAVVTDDIKTLSTAPGIGRKTAQRLILELKDKLSGIGEDIEDFVGGTTANVETNGERDEAFEALVALGFPRTEALKAVKAVYVEGMTAEKAIKSALKVLGG